MAAPPKEGVRMCSVNHVSRDKPLYPVSLRCPLSMVSWQCGFDSSAAAAHQKDALPMAAASSACHAWMTTLPMYSEYTVLDLILLVVRSYLKQNVLCQRSFTRNSNEQPPRTKNGTIYLVCDCFPSLLTQIFCHWTILWVFVSQETSNKAQFFKICCTSFGILKETCFGVESLCQT